MAPATMVSTLMSANFATVGTPTALAFFLLNRRALPNLPLTFSYLPLIFGRAGLSEWSTGWSASSKGRYRIGPWLIATAGIVHPMLRMMKTTKNKKTVSFVTPGTCPVFGGITGQKIIILNYSHNSRVAKGHRLTMTYQFSTETYPRCPAPQWLDSCDGWSWPQRPIPSGRITR